MAVKLIATGARMGKTFTFRGRKFVDGAYMVHGEVAQQAGEINYLAQTLQAYPVGSPEIPDAQVNIEPEDNEGENGADGEGSSSEELDELGKSTETNPSSEERQGADGDGDREARVAMIRGVISQLDRSNADHFRQDGYPTVAAVAEIAQDESVDRDLINAAMEIRHLEISDAVKLLTDEQFDESGFPSVEALIELTGDKTVVEKDVRAFQKTTD